MVTPARSSQLGQAGTPNLEGYASVPQSDRKLKVSRAVREEVSFIFPEHLLTWNIFRCRKVRLHG
jgi:hypothetical protein